MSPATTRPFPITTPSSIPSLFLTLLLPLLIALLVFAAPATGQDRRDGVTLYSDADFRGRAETFYQDVSELDRYGLDRRVSSLRVDRGCRVRLYAERDFRGAHVEIDTDVARLDRTAIGNDRARSLQIRCGWDVDWTPAVGSDDLYRGRDDDRDRYRDSDSDSRDKERYRETYDGDGRGRYDRRPGSAYAAGDAPVTLYRDSRFRGASESFGVGDVPDLTRSRVGNDGASSVRVAPPCRVRLYPAGNYRGQWIELGSDEADLSRTPLGNDHASSLKVRCSRWDPWGDDEGGGRYGDDRYGDDRSGGDRYGGGGYGAHYRAVTLFAGGGFRGASQEIFRDIPDLRGSAVGNDHASSVAVPPGCRVRLFAGGDYSGAWVELDGDEPDLGRTPVGNDQVSSVQVRCGRHLAWHGAGYGVVTLYRDSGFRGPSQSFSGDVPDVRLSGFGNDAASSVRVDPGCIATLYAGGDYRGAYVELRDDEPDLGRTPVGNDHVSSIRVRCR